MIIQSVFYQINPPNVEKQEIVHFSFFHLWAHCATVPLHELPPARLVIHRQTSAHERRKWTRSVQSRSGILAYLCTRQHWLWITVELHISGAPRGGCCSGRRSLRSCTPSFGLGTIKP